MIRQRMRWYAQTLRSCTRIALTSLQSWGSLHAFVVQFLVEPLLTYLFFYCFGMQLSDSSLSALVAAFVGSAWILALQCSANIVVFDRFAKTTTFLTLSSHQTARIFTWRYVVITFICFLSSLITSGIAVWLAGFGGFSLLSLSILLFFATVGGSIFGALGSIAGLFFSDGFAVTNVLLVVFPLVGGSVIPLTYFPPVITKALHLLPLCWLTDAARELGSAGSSEITAWIGALTALLALWMVAAILLWKLSVSTQRKTGHVEGMGI